MHGLQFHHFVTEGADDPPAAGRRARGHRQRAGDDDPRRHTLAFHIDRRGHVAELEPRREPRDEMIADAEIRGIGARLGDEPTGPAGDVGEEALRGRRHEREGDDAHALRGVIHPVAETHVGGAGELEPAKDAVHRHGPPVPQQQVEQRHDDEARGEADERRKDHGQDHFVINARLLGLRFLDHERRAPGENHGLHGLPVELHGVRAVGLHFVAERGGQPGGSGFEAAGFFLVNVDELHRTPHARGLAVLALERRDRIHANRRAQRRADEAADERVAGAARQAVPPRQQVPENRRAQRADEHLLRDELLLDEPRRNRFRDGEAEKRAEQIRHRRQQDGLARREDFRPDHGGDGVGGVVKAVRVGENQRDENDGENEQQFHAVRSFSGGRGRRCCRHRGSGPRPSR